MFQEATLFAEEGWHETGDVGLNVDDLSLQLQGVEGGIRWEVEEEPGVVVRQHLYIEGRQRINSLPVSQILYPVPYLISQEGESD